MIIDILKNVMKMHHYEDKQAESAYIIGDESMSISRKILVCPENSVDDEC